MAAFSFATGENAVAAELSVKHIKAPLLGMTVHSKATLTGIDGRKVKFRLQPGMRQAKLEKKHILAIV
ncbi:thioesterase, FlK family [Cellulosispirillum alkaliphilum]|uniref:thioesterase, FlK family n=1 Tax=Cellulosispirillum alkaliphilum TaxID=3039283 RepID=UPI003D6F4E09